MIACADTTEEISLYIKDSNIILPKQTANVLRKPINKIGTEQYKKSSKETDRTIREEALKQIVRSLQHVY